MSNLIVIDDHKIRKTAFSGVDRLLKKLQRMESNLETFHQRDQRLFSEWYALTFRDRQTEMDKLRGEYRDLADFHNGMHALAEMEDLPLAHAAFIIREEDRLLREGTEEDKKEIWLRRKAREEYIRNAHERRQKKNEPPPVTPFEREELEAIDSLSDEELSEWCSDDDIAFLMMGKSLRLALHSGKYDLFFRLWDVLHPKVQKQFDQRYKSQTGESLFDIITDMRAEKLAQEDEPPTVTPIPDTETFKLIYRQLARKLHPDMHQAQSSDGPDWRTKMWLRVQEAYQREDREELTHLYHLALLRGREYNALRLSDLKKTHDWLSNEIGQANQHMKSLRRSPAWGFSKRKEFDAIKAKLAKELDKDRRVLEAEVVEMRTHQAFLVRMGRADVKRRRR